MPCNGKNKHILGCSEVSKTFDQIWNEVKPLSIPLHYLNKNERIKLKRTELDRIKQKVSNKLWRKRNPEKIRENAKKYAEKHRERRKQHYKMYRMKKKLKLLKERIENDRNNRERKNKGSV